MNPDKLDQEFTRQVKHFSLSGCVQEGHKPSVQLVVVLGSDPESQTLPTVLCLLLLDRYSHPQHPIMD